MSLTALAEAEASAVARYKETAALSRGRLAEIQAEAAAYARADSVTGDLRPAIRHLLIDRHGAAL